MVLVLVSSGCLTYLFYIKPQPLRYLYEGKTVVLHTYSTSNHNQLQGNKTLYKLSYILILHQTTTTNICAASGATLSYILILHQTTTVMTKLLKSIRCLTYLFYIKPQHILYNSLIFNHLTETIHTWSRWYRYILICKIIKKILIVMVLVSTFSLLSPKYE